MFYFKLASAFVAFLAVLVGVLEVDHKALRPLQLPLIVGFELLFDRFQDPNDNLNWAEDFNGAMLPTQPVRDIPLLARTGALPHDLAGVFLRVGPNTVHWPPKKRTHVFDGDGMVYSVRLLDGKATFHCDYIQTPKYAFEQDAGREWFTRLGEFNGVSGMLKLLTVGRWKSKYAGLDSMESFSTANTAIGYTPDGKVWALNQAGPPFRLRVQSSGAVESIGFDRLHGTLHDAVSAHPKFDYRTKETFFHGTDPQSQRLYVGRIADGLLKEEATLTANPPIGQGFNHDMFITRDYVVVIDGSMRFDIASILRGSSLWTFDPTQKLRFGVYPRSKGNLTAENFVWIEAPFGAEIVHTLFGYNTGEKIVLWTSMCGHNPNRTEGVLSGMGHLKMTQIVIDVAAQSVIQEPVEGGDDFITEFGRVREDRVGGNARFGYSAMAMPTPDWKDFNFTGLLKWDLHSQRRVGVINFPDGVICGEPIFVPRGDAEDDGYVSLFLHDTNSGNASFVLYDAATFSQTPVVEFPVPWKVPLGFHGWWLGEQEFQHQLAVD